MTTGYHSLPPRPTHPSLEGFQQLHPSHQHAPGHHLPHPHSLPLSQGQTVVPSLIPHGMDPSQVDIRTFYPYQPNEVKHRKRTTRSQLRVLEGVYTHDTKPNAMLRKKLADELGMTPRGVQVWFQNRRAKEKNLAKKQDNGGQSTASGSSTSPSLSSTLASSNGNDNQGSDVLLEDESALADDPSPSASQHQLVDAAAKPTAYDDSENRSSVTSASSSSLMLPTVPALPTLDDLPHMDAISNLSPGSTGSAAANEHSPSSAPGGNESYQNASSMGIELASGLGLSAAELLAQRRPSLPILSVSSVSPLSSPLAGGVHMSPNLNMRMRQASGQQGPPIINGKGYPKNFDPSRRSSMDNSWRTVDNNIRRLGAHPLAHAAQVTSARNSGSLYPSSAAPILSRRSHSQAHVALETTTEGEMAGAPRCMPQTRTRYLTPTIAQPQTANQNHRPMLSQRVSLPSFHPYRQQQSSPRTVHSQLPHVGPQTATSAATTAPMYPGSGLGMFTDPFQPSSISASTSAPGSNASSAHGTPSSMFGTPISPHALPPPSPSSSAPPLPISQSFSGGSSLGTGISRRFMRPNPQQDFAHMGNHALSQRSVGPLPPGPLPEPSYSFGMPASASPSSGSPSALHDTPNGPVMNNLVFEEEDDASAVSSTYDPASRFGSLASIESNSSWTSACWSDEQSSQGRKLSGVEPPEAFNDERRDSIASGYLPQLFNTMDMNGGSTPQPMPEGGVMSDQHDPAPSRRGSSGSPHEQQYTDAYHGSQDGFVSHDAFGVHNQAVYSHAQPHQEGYPAEPGSYSPSSTISAGSQGGADGKGAGEQHHSVSPPIPQHSQSSELMYALDPSPRTEDSGSSQSEVSYSQEFSDPAPSMVSNLHLSPDHQQFHAISPKPSHYPSLPYPQEGDVSNYGDMSQHVTYDPSAMHYSYDMYIGTPIYANGALDLGSACVPVSMSMDSLHTGNYMPS